MAWLTRLENRLRNESGSGVGDEPYWGRLSLCLSLLASIEIGVQAWSVQVGRSGGGEPIETLLLGLLCVSILSGCVALLLPPKWLVRLTWMAGLCAMFGFAGGTGGPILSSMVGLALVYPTLRVGRRLLKGCGVFCVFLLSQLFAAWYGGDIHLESLLLGAGLWLPGLVLLRRKSRPAADIAMIKPAHSRGAIEVNEELADQHYRALEYVAGSLAHEINNPLAIISVATYTLVSRLGVKGPEAEEKQRKLLDTILVTIDRISQIMARLLVLSRDRLSDPLQTHRLDTVFSDVEELCRAQIHDQGIIWQCENPEGLAVDIRKGHLANAIVSLINNSVDALVGTKGERWIRLEAEPDPKAAHSVLIRVLDSGPGMSNEIEKQALLPFFSTKESRHASGLGLSIAKLQIEAMGGRLRIVSGMRPTCVEIVLPLSLGAEKVA